MLVLELVLVQVLELMLELVLQLMLVLELMLGLMLELMLELELELVLQLVMCWCCAGAVLVLELALELMLQLVLCWYWKASKIIDLVATREEVLTGPVVGGRGGSECLLSMNDFVSKCQIEKVRVDGKDIQLLPTLNHL